MPIIALQKMLVLIDAVMEIALLRSPDWVIVKEWFGLSVAK